MVEYPQKVFGQYNSWASDIVLRLGQRWKPQKMRDTFAMLRDEHAVSLRDLLFAQA